MALDIHPECKKRIIEIVTEELPYIVVNNKMFLGDKSFIGLLLKDDSLPTRGSVKTQLEQYIGESPLYVFLTETLYKELSETQKYDSNPTPTKLTELEGYEDPLAVGVRLIESFTTLPWRYTLTIKFKNDFGEIFRKTIKHFTVSDSIKLFCPDKQFKTDFSLQSGNVAKDRSLSGNAFTSPRLYDYKPQEWDENATYIQIKVDGFIGKYASTFPLEDALSILKSFCGLSIALRLLKVNTTYHPRQSIAKFFVHKHVDGKWIIENSHELDFITSDTFNDLVIHDFDDYLDIQDKKTRWFTSKLILLNCAFSHKEKSKKIILAGQWLFESYCGSNGLLSFVQSTVALEILLGEKKISDLMGLGELLRNRCAYLIGKTHQQREEVLSDFKKIYEIRSKIVHRGKSKLNNNEKFLFSKLQWMCRRVICEEINLLSKDIQNALTR